MFYFTVLNPRFGSLGTDGAMQDILLVDHLGSFDHNFKFWRNCIRHTDRSQDKDECVNVFKLFIMSDCTSD